MYINHCVFEKTPFDGLHLESVNRHDQMYFADLYARYQDDTTINSNQQVYHYESMGMRLLNLLSDQTALRKIDLVIFSSNQFSRVTEYGSPEFFLKNFFEISAELFEFKELGILCVFASLHFMLTLNNRYHYQKVLCCSIEGEWIKKNRQNQKNQLINNYIAGIIIEPTKNYDTAVCFKRIQGAIKS